MNLVFPPQDPVAVRIQETGELLASKARIARTPLERALGLLTRSSLEPGEALVLPSCCSVHMFFMRFPIDVVFCSHDRKIIAVQENLQPWRLSWWVPKASFVIELPEGSTAQFPALSGVTLDFIVTDENPRARTP